MNKLGLIIDALSELMYSNSTAVAENKYFAALNAANELKALKPVAWWYRGKLHEFEPTWATDPLAVQPLYALGARP